LIFLDTNILLDFYRMKSGQSLSLLQKIDTNHEKIITSTQVEMEFKKNRQKVIIESINKMKTPEWSVLTPPAFLSDSKKAKATESKKKGINALQQQLRKKIETVLKQPRRYDKVYLTLQRLFKSDNEINLNRNKKIRYLIRRQAYKRFLLGYPPRKDKDITIGDSTNWEWILYCAKKQEKNIIIVTRDSDYGSIINDECIINDWLCQEFKDRVSRKKEVILTDKLSVAFKKASITVTETQEKEEAIFIDDSKKEISDLSEQYKRDLEILFNKYKPSIEEYLKQQNESLKIINIKNK